MNIKDGKLCSIHSAGSNPQKSLSDGTLDAGGSAVSGHHLSLCSELSQTKAPHKNNLHFAKLDHTSKAKVKVNASVNFCLHLGGGEMRLGFTYTNILCCFDRNRTAI